MAYVKSYRGIGEMLVMPGMVAAMARRAEKVAIRARATAPVQSGRYKASFVVSSGVRPAAGMRRARAYGRVTNTSTHARIVEFGTEKQAGHRTLGRALDAARE